MGHALHNLVLREFDLYSEFHRNHVNRVIHYVFVPLIHLSTCLLVACFSSMTVVLFSVLAFFGLYLCLDVRAGLVSMPYLAMVFAMSSAAFKHLPRSELIQLAVAVNISGWLAQFVGHAVFEKRAPAVTESFFGSLLTAPLFVNLEVVSELGLAPRLMARLEGMRQGVAGQGTYDRRKG